MKLSTQEAKKIFDRVLENAKSDSNILAFWLDGSRGKGIIEHAESDYDCTMIVEDKALADYKTRYENMGNPDFEIGVLTLAEFKKLAAWGSDTAWQRYNYVGLNPMVDKTGQLGKLFKEKASIPESEINYLGA